MTPKQLREQRARIVEEARNLVNRAEQEKRDLTAEERAAWDKALADADALKADIDRAERQESLERELATSQGTRAGQQDTSSDADNRARKENAEQRKQAHARAFDSYLRHGVVDMPAEQRTVLMEYRAQSTVDASGGFTIPEGFSNQLEESMKAFGGMRQASRVFPTASGNDLPWPTVDDTANTGALLAENTAVAEQDFTFANIILKAFKYSSKMVKVSVELLQDSAFDLSSFLARALGERIGRITNTHFTTGDNVAKPQGVVTGATSGLTAASATTITADELIDLVHSVDPAYRIGPQVGWMFNDKTFKVLRKLKDGEGRYLWNPGLQPGAVDSLFGYRYIINQDVADLATASKSVLFGDFSKYLIRDVLGIAVLRLVERFADSHQVAYLAFSRHDGRVLDAGTDPIRFITQA